MSRIDGKVALVTGAARDAHALTLARRRRGHHPRGIAGPIGTGPYEMATPG
jgi:hypothetical protein